MSGANAIITRRTTLGPQYRKHAALRGNATVPVSSQEWYQVNQNIQKTTEKILRKNYVLEGLGPGVWKLDGGFGIALVAEVIIRPLKKECSLADPKLQKKIRAMADDPTHGEFRHTTWEDGKVWFRFKVLDLDEARKEHTLEPVPTPPVTFLEDPDYPDDLEELKAAVAKARIKQSDILQIE
ncbi:hypothetical protein F4780DRAFT_795410 [Xylariomycetidae sp. FL0641]|nr:hypothetical protein F4780DRAFT_795410 [Xylariomycetidae sp. FL0641]